MTERYLWISSVLPRKFQDLHQIWPQPLPFAFFSNYFLIIPLFNAESSKLLIALLNKPKVHKNISG
jgi:hypothetical protein